MGFRPSSSQSVFVKLKLAVFRQVGISKQVVQPYFLCSVAQGFVFFQEQQQSVWLSKVLKESVILRDFSSLKKRSSMRRNDRFLRRNGVFRLWRTGGLLPPTVLLKLWPLRYATTRQQFDGIWVSNWGHFRTLRNESSQVLIPFYLITFINKVLTAWKGHGCLLKSK